MCGNMRATEGKWTSKEGAFWVQTGWRIRLYFCHPCREPSAATVRRGVAEHWITWVSEHGYEFPLMGTKWRGQISDLFRLLVSTQTTLSLDVLWSSSASTDWFPFADESKNQSGDTL